MRYHAAQITCIGCWMDAVTKSEKKPDWLASHVLFLKSLKAPSEAQQLLILLAGKNILSPKEQKTFDVLIKSEKAAEKAKAARLAVSSLLSSEKNEAAEKARKERNHKLILNGLLFDYVGVTHLSRAELLGLLIEGAKTDMEKIKEWAVAGAAMLAVKEPSKAAPALAPDPLSQAEQAIPDIRTDRVYLNVEIAEKDAAKMLGARWDADLKKWYAPPGIDVSLFEKWLP